MIKTSLILLSLVKVGPTYATEISHCIVGGN
jgi:hypothetical protein